MTEPGGPEHTGMTLDLLEALRPYLAESLMVLDRDWTVKVNLAPPGGLIGRGLGIGVHTLEDMHPDDALQVMDLGLQAFETEEGWQGSIIVRMHRGDGRYAPYEITAVNHFEHPLIQGMVVRTREVPSDAANAWPGIEPRLAVSTLAELLPIGVLLLDPAGRVVFANETACGMLRREPEALKRDGFIGSLHPEDRPIVEDSLARVGAGAALEDCTVRFVDAAIERAECRFCSEGEPDVTCIAITIEDVTERFAERRALEQRANRDALTGLHNRASLHELLQQRLDDGEPTAVAFVDLDGFKAVNDRWGHDRGDQVLVAVAGALRAGVADGTELGRVGGDEFVVVATPDGEDPDAWAARLEKVVATAVAVEDLGVRCSVGTSRAQPGDTLRDLLHRADRAMYEAKARRR